VPQFNGSRKPAPGIVYDSDLGSTIDTVLALALLHGLEGKTECRIAGLTISNPGLKSAQLCDLIEKFYASAITGIAATFFKGAPIGLASAGKDDGTPIATALLAKKDDNGKPIYSPAIHNLNDTAVPEILLRNALTAQYDHTASMVLAGPAMNVVKLLELRDARDLIQAKVKVLVIAGEPTGLPAEWPTPIVIAGKEIGEAIPFPGASIETDFAYAPAHPVAAAYRAYRAMPYDASATAMAAVLYAARPKENYFQLQPAAGGKHQRLVADPSRKEEIQKIYATLASAKPSARGFRIPAQVADEIKATEGKKDQPDKQ
jgi:hypothetical protein